MENVSSLFLPCYLTGLCLLHQRQAGCAQLPRPQQGQLRKGLPLQVYRPLLECAFPLPQNQKQQHSFAPRAGNVLCPDASSVLGGLGDTGKSIALFSLPIHGHRGTCQGPGLKVEDLRSGSHPALTPYLAGTGHAQGLL